MSAGSEVAVVIPAYNAEEYLAETLSSLLSQTMPEWRAIVVDDGSSDRTAEIVRGFSDPRINLKQQENAGVSAARNTGLESVYEEFLLFLDADDYLFPDSLQRLITVLSSDASLVLAYGEVQRLRNGELVQPVSNSPIFSQRPDGSEVSGFFVSNSASTTGSVMFRTNSVRSVSGFNVELELGEDWELITRLVTRGAIRYLPGAPVCVYREHGKSAVKRHAMKIEEALKPVSTIFSNSLVIDYLSREEHTRLAGLATVNAHIYCASENFKAGHWRQARAIAMKGLRIKPFEPRLWILWFFAGLHWIPRLLESRLK